MDCAALWWRVAGANTAQVLQVLFNPVCFRAGGIYQVESIRLGENEMKVETTFLKEICGKIVLCTLLAFLAAVFG